MNLLTWLHLKRGYFNPDKNSFNHLDCENCYNISRLKKKKYLNCKLCNCYKPNYYDIIKI